MSRDGRAVLNIKALLLRTFQKFCINRKKGLNIFLVEGLSEKINYLPGCFFRSRSVHCICVIKSSSHDTVPFTPLINEIKLSTVLSTTRDSLYASLASTVQRLFYGCCYITVDPATPAP
jgi:hypothetical protein